MARSMLAAGLLLAALLLAPSASAAHDDPDCRVESVIEEVEHYSCAVTVGLGIILQPLVEFAVCISEADPVTVNVAYVLGCL